jgi:hypothetical protein
MVAPQSFRALDAAWQSTSNGAKKKARQWRAFFVVVSCY